MPALTAMKVAKASYPEGKREPFLISDGQGLNLQVTPNGSKSWVLRFMIAGKSRMMGLGAYGDGNDAIALAKARERAADARALINRGLCA
jgi:hypothetical protein